MGHTISTYIRRSLHRNHKKVVTPATVAAQNHKQRVYDELQKAGLPRYELLRMESRYLPHIIHDSEHIGGMVYGHHKDGFAVIVATDMRVIFLDKKPLFINEDEITYRAVSGVSFNHAGPGAMVTLHTKIKDYPIQTLNERCAEKFVEYIEARCLENKTQGVDYDYTASGRNIQAR